MLYRQMTDRQTDTVLLAPHQGFVYCTLSARPLSSLLHRSLFLLIFTFPLCLFFLTSLSPRPLSHLHKLFRCLSSLPLLPLTIPAQPFHPLVPLLLSDVSFTLI